MKQLTIALTNEQHRNLEYWLSVRYGKRGKMENKARVVLFGFIAEEAQKQLDISLMEYEAADEGLVF